MIKHECRRTKECRTANSQEIAALLLFDLRHSTFGFRHFSIVSMLEVI